MEKQFQEIKIILEKIKYHQKLLLSIACHENPEELSFFQQILMYDLEERQVNLLIKLLNSFDSNRDLAVSEIHEFEEFGIEFNTLKESSFELLEENIKKLKINIPLKYLLLAMEKQNILNETCKKIWKTQ